MDENSGRSRVALVRCNSYDREAVYAAVAEGLSLLGGATRFVSPGEQILLKVNLLAGSPPEKNVTTHPAVLAAVARHFQALDAKVSYGDSPGIGRPENAARRAQLTPVAEELRLPLADFVHGETVSFPDGQLIKQFTLAKGVLTCDGLVSLPKMKSHALTRMTGAVKNQFGCIPGILKGEFHARLPEMELFAKMLVDLNLCLRPRLYIMDGVVAMEGNGPRSGSARPMSVLLFSEDPVALDATASRMMALPPERVPTTRWGAEMGLGVYDPVEILGETLENFVFSNYEVNRSKASTTGGLTNEFISRQLKQWMVPRPVIDSEKCTRCGNCVNVCPAQPKALSFQKENERSHPPVYNYADCIRCYCCQELCPESAIHVKTPLLGRLVHH